MNGRQGEVLVGFDGSVEAQQALEWAIRDARLRHASLRVFVAESSRLGYTGMEPPDWARMLVDDVADLAHSILERADMTSGRVDVVADGSPSHALIRESAGPLITVLGSHGHGRIAGQLLGSVSQHVTAHAPGPVVVVRPQANPTATRVVVGVDGSPGSAPALDFAFEHASRTGASLFAVHGWRLAGSVVTAMNGHVPDRAASEIHTAEKALGEYVDERMEKYPEVKTSCEAIPVPAARVLADASLTAALVVVGSRGRGAFEGMLLGSVSQAVLHRAHCPVAVVR